jgi:ElaB/YqjD/DUF883 family membrane-anchored ribosome-binding protein
MDNTTRIMDELRAAFADAEELLRATAGEAGPRVQEVRERAEQSLRNAKAHLEGAGRDLDAMVRENPWAAIGIAAGVGLVVGVLLSRKP